MQDWLSEAIRCLAWIRRQAEVRRSSYLNSHASLSTHRPWKMCIPEQASSDILSPQGWHTIVYLGFKQM